ncbi:MAG: DUF192 domain-containing protein [Pseudomonadota bacterium]
MSTAKLEIVNRHGEIVEIKSLIADSSFERSLGYQYVCPDVIASSTILFQYPRPIKGQFHMNNVHAPLDIGFFAADGILVTYLVMETYQDNYRPLYGPNEPFQFALEAPVGFFRENGFEVGNTRLIVGTQ